LVIIATNTDGIYTKASMRKNKKETIISVTDIDKLQNEISADKSSQGTGGMQSKIDAAYILRNNNIETWIVNGIGDDFINKAINNEITFTKILNK